MSQIYFIWNGVDCRSMGIELKNPIPIVRPQERVKHVEIPGRPGDLTQTEGEDIYNSYIQPAVIQVKGGYRVREINNWLKGSGYVTFHGEPDRKQPARIIGAVTLNRISRNLDIWAGEVQFYCQPLKELLYPVSTTVSTTAGTVENDGDVAALPKMTVNAAAAGSTIVITMNGKTFTVDMDGMADTGCVVDCDAKIVTNYAGTADLTALSAGDFPVLPVGSTAVTGSGWASIVFDKRERYL